MSEGRKIGKRTRSFQTLFITKFCPTLAIFSVSFQISVQFHNSMTHSNDITSSIAIVLGFNGHHHGVNSWPRVQETDF